LKRIQEQAKLTSVRKRLDEYNSRAEDLLNRMGNQPLTRFISPLMVELRPNDAVLVEFCSESQAKKFLKSFLISKSKFEISQAFGYLLQSVDSANNTTTVVCFATVKQNVPSITTFREAVKQRDIPLYNTSEADGIFLELASSRGDYSMPVTITQKQLDNDMVSIWSDRCPVNVAEELSKKGMSLSDKVEIVEYCLSLLGQGGHDITQKLTYLVEFYK